MRPHLVRAHSEKPHPEKPQGVASRGTAPHGHHPQAHRPYPSRPLNRLPPWQRRLGAVSGVALLASGAAWLVFHQLLATDGLPHPGEAWAMKLHGLAAMLALFVLGALGGGHLRHGWQLTRRHGRGLRHQRRLGVALASLAGALALSGYALYYWVPEAARDAVGWVHAGIGFTMAALLLLHRRGRD